MFKSAFIVTFGVVALVSSASSQPASKEETLKQLTALVQNLKQDSPMPREQAYLKLQTYRPLPPEIVPALAKLIAEETGDNRTIAAAVLAEITPNDASLVKPLEEGLLTKDAATAVAALRALEKMGPLAKPVFPKVLVLLETGPVNVKTAAIPVAASMGKEAVEPLQKVILRAVEMRKKNDQAAVALGKVGPDATPTILKMLDMDDPGVDYHAAVALRSMTKKPVEAIKPMLRLAQHKDYNVRRPAFDYLVDVIPTPAVTEALWSGIEDRDGMILAKCLDTLRARDPDKKRWAQALKSVLMRSSVAGGSVATLHELYQYDRKEADALVLPMALHILGYQQQRKVKVIHLSTLEKELIPHLPKIYDMLNRPEKGNVQGRINVITLLAHLAPEHTKRVADKMQSDLKSKRWELKLAAGQALLRTKPQDKAPLARALAEVLTTPKLPYDFPMSEVLDDLRGMGPDAAAALPSLRIAQTTARADYRAHMLLTMVAIDPSSKEYAGNIGQKMYESTTDKYAGAVLLCELGVLKTDETLKVLDPFLNKPPMNTFALRMVETLGPKAKPLVPMLEAKLAEPKQLHAAQIIQTLGKIDGNQKQMLDRLIKTARDNPKQLANVARACSTLGAEARPVLPALLELNAKHPGGVDFIDAIARIDPHALNRTVE